MSYQNKNNISVRNILVSFTLFLIVGITVMLFYPYFKNMLGTTVKNIQNFEQQHQTIVDNVRQELFTTPLQKLDDSKKGTISHDGVFIKTNSERSNNGVARVRENRKLDAAAAIKLKDMFDRQYFEHISPDGHGPGYLATHSGYTYIIVGENLALGNFKDDQALLDAWMNSPGHRANILNTRFVDLGVAVGQGMYQGKKTWLAVQEFGKPASDCPALDTALKVKVETDKQQLDQQTTKLAEEKQALSMMPSSTQQEQTAYNQKVDQYNADVADYNTKRIALQSEIAEYNTEVQKFNICIGQ